MKLGITMLIHNKDDIEFVTEFPCFLDTLYLIVGVNRTVAEFKEFERRFKYGWFHLKLFEMSQDFSRRLI